LRSQDLDAGNGSGAFTPDTDRFVLRHSNNPTMQALERTMAQVAPTDIPVLLVGETGTGKEVFARQIHRLSSRCSQPLVKAICASPAGEALTAHFAASNGQNNGNQLRSGTLFLKEIAELDSGNQRTLLYALPEDGATSSAGSGGPRIISSTTRNLEEELRAGRFRTELYYRINGTCLRLPALRQRREDIAELVELFLPKYSSLLGRPRPAIASQELAVLEEYSWPGNIRELENVVKKMVVVNDAAAVLSELSKVPGECTAVAAGGKGSVLKTATRAASRRTERQLILEALNRTRWNRKRAARELQISYKALLYKLKQIGAEEPDPI